jgi:hypothetical protein
MLVGRCSWEHSGRELHWRKSHKLRAKPRDLAFYGRFVEMFVPKRHVVNLRFHSAKTSHQLKRPPILGGLFVE